MKDYYDDEDSGDEYIDDDTDDRVYPPQPTIKKKKYPKKIWIEKQDFVDLLKIVDETYEPGGIMWFNLKLLYHVLYWSGLRISEVLELSRKQIIDFINGQSIQVVISKTKNTRSLLNTKTIYEKFEYFRTNQHMIAEVGFSNTYGRKLTFRQAQKWSYPCMYKLQMKKFDKVDNPSKLLITLHSFRCSYINRLLRNNVSLPDVSMIVNHKNVSTTMGYLRSYPDIQRFNTVLDNVDF
jgi:integrase/recombinase XerD